MKPLFHPRYSWLVVSSLLASPNLAVMADDNVKQLLTLPLEDLLDIRVQEVSLASGFKQRSTQAPAVTSVITAQEIQASGANDIADVLRMVPGLYVEPNEMFEQNYQIRAIESFSNNETLMLINGQPYKNLLSGDRGAWAGFPVENIARIEVIRGPGSALYGADAFSGVLNIITKTGQDIDGTQTGARIASERGRDAWLLHGGEYQGVELATNLHYYSTHSDSALNQFMPPPADQATANPPLASSQGEADNRLKRINASLDLSKANWRFNMDYYGVRSTFYAEAGVTNDDSSEDEDRGNITLSYHNEDWHPDWELDAELSYTRWNSQEQYYENLSLLDAVTDIDSSSLGATSGLYDIQQSEEHWRLHSHFLYRGWNKHKLHFGLGYTDERLADLDASVHYADADNLQHSLALADAFTRNNPSPDRRIFHAFAQDTWSIRRNLELTAGLRYDRYSDFGSSTNPRLALVWQTSDALSSKFLYGKAFMAPTYSLLNIQDDSFITANSDLTPQLIETYELAFDYHPNKTWNLALNLFYYEVEDKFGLVPLGDKQGLSLQNLEKQNGHGGELEVHWRMSEHSKLSAHYAYAKTNEREQAFSGYPLHQSYLRHHWVFNQAWYLNSQLNWAHYTTPNGTGAGFESRDYTHVGLSLHYQNTGQHNWQVALGVNNLFNANAEHWISELSLPERRYFVELRYQFK